MGSVWSESVHINSFEKLHGNAMCDVLIIGGGIAGILCAYFLQQQGVNYLLAEGASIGSGTTKNTTAQITAQHGLLYSQLIKNAGVEKAKQYLYANLWAVKKYEALCGAFACEYEHKPSFTYTLTDKAKIEKEVAAVNRLGFFAEYTESTCLPLKIQAAIKFPNQAQFNPLKFIACISKGLNIREHTFVKKVKGTTAYTDSGVINAKKIIVATHFPFINAHGLYFAKLYQTRSYVLALKDAQNINGMYADEGQHGLYFRNYQNLLLVGGGDHRTGKPGGAYRDLRNFVKTCYPYAAEAYAFAAQDCMSLDGVPYIGRYSPKTPSLFVATSFNEWGMTSAMVSAKLLTDMVLEKPSEFADVFSPERPMLKGQLFVNALETVGGLLLPTAKRCPHLGCGLKWNAQEHTWDCACHGSRFTAHGALIDNPAMRDAHVE